MTAKEYLQQAYRLDSLIDAGVREISSLRHLAQNVTSLKSGERVQTSTTSEAPFVRYIEAIAAQEDEVNRQIDLLVALKKQIKTVIKALPDRNEQLVLWYRYTQNMTWEQIGEELHANRTTVYRWHNTALDHIVLPKNPIII